MTVGDWVTERAGDAPPALLESVLAALGEARHAPASESAEACLAAATRSLERLVAEGRFARVHALELLAVDALTTLAFEHAAVSDVGTDALTEFARAGASTLGQLDR